jgi:hypothetical protein
MKAGRFVLYASAVAAVLVIALLASFGLRDRNQVAASASPTAPTTPSAASASPIASSSPSATAAAAGTMTGGLGYPSEFIPPLTVFAISVADQRVFFSVDTPRYGGGPNASPPAATIAPGTRPMYTITGVAPGTYYVLAYRNDDVNVEAKNRPGVYSRYVLQCLQPTEAGSTPAPGCSPPGDHSLVPVTVRAGETVSRIDVTDWYYQQETYPARPR